MFSKKVSVTYTPFLWYVKGPEPKILEFIEDSVESHRPDKTLHHWTQSADGRPCHIQNGYPDDVVLDPLLGTGTTAIAALKLNRRFIAKEALVD
jgi:DNA methylase